MAIELVYNNGSEDFCSMIFGDEDCLLTVEDVELLDFDGVDIGLNAEIEVSKSFHLAIEIDFNNKNGVSFEKTFHCEQHATEFLNRNFNGTVRIGYLIHVIKWDRFDFWGEV